MESSRRVNLVREGFEAWNAEDPQWILNNINNISPEIEWVAPERDPFPGSYKGFEGVQEFWAWWRNAVGQLKFIPEKVIDAGDHVVVIAHRWARNDITGLRISRRSPRSSASTTTTTSASGREFYDRGTALRAAGAY